MKVTSTLTDEEIGDITRICWLEGRAADHGNCIEIANAAATKERQRIVDNLRKYPQYAGGVIPEIFIDRIINIGN